MHLQMDILRSDALTTTRWPIDPAEVVAAYRRTGLTPVRHEWFDRQRNCACAIGVLVAPTVPPDVTLLDVDDVLDQWRNGETWGCYSAEDWLDEFIRVFDEPSVEECEVAVADVVQDSEAPGWMVLARRNALAVRRALHAANLDPVDVGAVTS